ncbi:MAG: beta-hydroxyacyl-ACP dehydratase [Betaproteobacteria bacterium]|nr:beta-hydroxyacyl-ACP dehydratase [Betaproteobacteria bacterium]
MKVVSELRLAADHPAYAGHFPGNPVLPGVVLLDAALHCVATSRCYPPQRWQILSAKFLRVVRPGDVLHVEHEAAAGETVKWRIRAANEIVARGTFGPA